HPVRELRQRAGDDAGGQPGGPLPGAAQRAGAARDPGELRRRDDQRPCRPGAGTGEAGGQAQGTTMSDATPQRRLRLVNAAAEIDGRLAGGRRARRDAPGGFRAEALAETARAGADAPAGREDATDLPLVTSGAPGAKDLDQAMFLERAGDGYVVPYAIA